MKCFRRSCCALVCLALLLVAFSPVANADTITLPSYHIYVTSLYNRGTSTDTQIGALTFTPNNGDAEYNETSSTAWLRYGLDIYTQYTIATDDSSVLVESGRDVNLSIQNIFDTVVVSGNGDFFCYGNYTDVRVHLFYVDGTTEQVNASYTYEVTGDLNVKANFNPAKDVVKILIHTDRFIPHGEFSHVLKYDAGAGGYYSGTITRVLGEVRSDNDYKISIERSSEEAGLLSGIIGILNGFDNVLADIVQSILDIPSVIINGIKNLFVPAQEELLQFKTDLEELLEDRLGAVWQVIHLTLETWDRIDSSQEKGMIYLPEVTIPVSKTVNFSFGGYYVTVVPDKFQGVAETVRLVTGIIATFVFINGLRKRYEDILGVKY